MRQRVSVYRLTRLQDSLLTEKEKGKHRVAWRWVRPVFVSVCTVWPSGPSSRQLPGEALVIGVLRRALAPSPINPHFDHWPLAQKQRPRVH